MKIEDAIKEIKNIEYMQCECEECKRHRPALQLAIKVLEKQQRGD